MSKTLKAFLQGSAILALSNIALKAINFFLLPLYTAYLTTEQLGASDVITNLTSLVFTLAVLGLDSAYSAFFYDEKTQEHKNKVFSTISIALMATSLVVLLMVLIAPQLSQILFQTSGYEIAIALSLVGVAVHLWYLPFTLDLRIQNKMLPYAIVTVLASLVLILSNIFFVVYLQLGFYSLILSALISNAFQLLAYVVVTKKIPRLKLFSSQLLRPMLKYSLALLPSVVAIWVVNLSSTYFMQYNFGPSIVGIFGIALRFVTVLGVFTNAIYVSYTAFAFQTYHEDENAPEKFSAILSGLFVLLAIICFSVSLFGKEIIGVMTAPDYLPAYEMLPMLLFAQLIYGLNTLIGYGMSFSKRPIFNTLSVVIGSVVSLILNFWLVPKYGGVGAAWVQLISYIVIGIFMYHFSMKLYRVPYEMGKIVPTTIVLFVLVLAFLDASITVKIVVYLLAMAGVIVVFRNRIIPALNLLRKKHA